MLAIGVALKPGTPDKAARRSLARLIPEAVTNNQLTRKRSINCKYVKSRTYHAMSSHNPAGSVKVQFLVHHAILAAHREGYGGASRQAEQ